VLLAAAGIAVAVAHAAGSPTPPRPSAGLTPQPLPIAPTTSSAGHLSLPKLRHLTPPDIAVRVDHRIAPRAVQRLRRASGVHRVAVLDRGTIRVSSHRLRVAGVPVTAIRAFTPSLTARSKPLWRSVARGDLTVSFASARHLRHQLGATVPASGRHHAAAPLRIGAFATLGLPHIQAVVTGERSGTLGLALRREVLVAAPKAPLDQLHAMAHRILGRRAHVIVTRPKPVDQSMASSYARETIPATYLDLYRRAAVTCPGLPWTVLAGIGTVETGNGTNVHTSIKGAEGPMQFLPSTWAMYGYDADGDGKADIQDPVDAVFSAARYLCAAGGGLGGQSQLNAIYAYNHAWWYVREVVSIANQLA
jgi:hypothetical protein